MTNLLLEAQRTAVYPRPVPLPLREPREPQPLIESKYERRVEGRREGQYTYCVKAGDGSKQYHLRHSGRAWIMLRVDDTTHVNRCLMSHHCLAASRVDTFSALCSKHNESVLASTSKLHRTTYLYVTKRVFRRTHLA